MSFDEAAMMARLGHARVARLATVSRDCRPHLVPVTFVLRANALVTAVDRKPKASVDLKRLRNVRENSRVVVLADEYDDMDWSKLWWVRVDGSARVLEAEEDVAAPLAWLSEKYRQYQEAPPAGPVIRISIESVTGWSFLG
jgi:PPOX class probable F420-dependent enzyme